MIASNAPATTMTHFAHAAGKKKRAMTTTAAANRKRQKHKLILTSPSGKNFPYTIKKKSIFQVFIFMMRQLFKVEQRTHPDPLYPQGTAAFSFVELIMVLTDSLQKFRLQSVSQGGISHVGVGIGSERTGLDIAVCADVNKSPAGRQTASDFFFIPRDGDKKCSIIRSKGIPFYDQVFSLFFRKEPVFGSLAYGGVLDKKGKLAPKVIQILNKLPVRDGEDHDRGGHERLVLPSSPSSLPRSFASLPFGENKGLEEDSGVSL